MPKQSVSSPRVEAADLLIIDGAQGEGGGQILRTALALSVITGRAFRLVHIRARRRNPGLQPQHLSATRAAAAICDAQLSGDRLDSGELLFAPAHPARPESYSFDVAEIAGHGSAGSTILVLQTILVPLALAGEISPVVVRGGTHQEWAPAFDDFNEAYLPALRRMGFHADAELRRWGWYPIGEGEVACRIAGLPPSSDGALRPLSISALDRSALMRITGRGESPQNRKITNPL